LYHGTNAAFLSSIEKHGLKPKISNSLSDKGVYLTDNLNKAAAYCSGLEIILEIDVDFDVLNDYQDLPQNKITQQFLTKDIIPAKNIKNVFIPKHLLKSQVYDLCTEEVVIGKSILPHSILFFNEQISNIIEECEIMENCKEYAIFSLQNLHIEKLNDAISNLKQCISHDECLNVLKNIQLFNDNDIYDTGLWCKFPVNNLSSFKSFYNKTANINNLVNKFSYIVQNAR
jgi:hypothetical protein